MIPLRPRLNSVRIEAGLITNRCKIRLISPLERRTYAEEKAIKFTSIDAIWSVIFASIGLVV